MNPRTHRHLLPFLLLALAGCSSTESIRWPGMSPDGRILLPNGWYLSPVGKHAEVGELPMRMVVSPDGQYVIVNNNGTREHALSVIETATWKRVQHLPVAKSWLGLTMSSDGREVMVSGGNDNRILRFAFQAGVLTLTDSIALGAPRPQQKIWVGGLDYDEKHGRVFVTGRESDSLYVVDLKSRTVVQRRGLPATPYTCLLSRNGTELFVSLWGASAVGVFDPTTLELRTRIGVGDHPCDMALTPDGGRLFVANANHNSVSVISVPQGKVLETILTSLTPSAPFGSTPNALALSPDGSTLFVANADNNYCAVFDVREPQRSRSLGFVPTGWYPTALGCLPGSGRVVVASGKGFTSLANPDGPNPAGKKSQREEYIGSLFRGMVTLLPELTPETLRALTPQVYANSPYTDRRLSAPGEDSLNPIPHRHGAPSPIKHVFYIIKENRTYDQVFGDMPEGNGARELCLFPDTVTPNHHALARQFVLLDNFYCNAEVSADGHNWSMGAYATDYVEKTWPTSYGGRGGNYEFEGGYPIVYPSAGYLWDNCKRNDVTYRSYGEWTATEASSDSAKALMPSLEGHIAPHYRGWDLNYSDVDRVRAWMEEFDEYEKNGRLPQFQILKLPNDHTEGTRKGSLTPRAYVAQNDLALGMVIDRISRSRYWGESAIFVVEDDAQNGPDHVDAHRTVALVISPWTKHGSTDSELYSTTSMIRTMELILSMPPLSQFDAAATPMYASFSPSANVSPYRCRPAGIDITERNPAGAVGQARSNQFDFSAEDRIPDLEFSEIIWKAVKGPESNMPPPVRSAFVRVGTEGDGER